MIELTIKGIPKNEKVWARQILSNGEVFYITAKEHRDFYYLYKISNELDDKSKKKKLDYGFKSYAEAYDTLLYGRIGSEIYTSALKLIFGKDITEKKDVLEAKEEIIKRLNNKLRAFKTARAKTPLEFKVINEVLR